MMCYDTPLKNCQSYLSFDFSCNVIRINIVFHWDLTYRDLTVVALEIYGIRDIPLLV